MKSYVGNDHGDKFAADFYATDISSGKIKSMQIKSLMASTGKICPSHTGQSTSKSFDKYWRLPFEGDICNHENRFKFIRNNITTFLNKQLENLQSCDYIFLVDNCRKIPNISILRKLPLNWFDKKLVTFTKENYSDFDNTKDRPKEFSTTLKTTIEGNEITIGELQFHFKSRNQVKFRYDKKFLVVVGEYENNIKHNLSNDKILNSLKKTKKNSLSKEIKDDIKCAKLAIRLAKKAEKEYISQDKINAKNAIKDAKKALRTK
jgi:hypothetical protein